MYPIIRRRRFPLDSPEPAAIVPTPPTATPSPAPVPGSRAPVSPLPAPKTENHVNSVQFCSVSQTVSPAAAGAEKSKIENHANSVQFCSVSPPPASAPGPAAPNSQPLSSIVPPAGTKEDQPSVLNSPPPSLWSRQPDEAPEDYQIFAAWLQLPVPRPSRKAAATALGCSRNRLNRLYARHRWKTRATAYDNHRANAASEALDALLQKETLNWRERAQQFRLQEWILHEDLMIAALQAVDELMKHPRNISLTELTKLIELASVLGRRASGMPLDPGSAAPSKPESPSGYPSFEECLRRAYGSNAGPATRTPSAASNSPPNPRSPP